MVRRGQAVEKSSSEEAGGRLKFLSSLFIVAACVLSVRLLFVQVIEHPAYEALAETQQSSLTELTPKRGELYAQDKTSADGITPLAINRDMYHVYAEPSRFKGSIDDTARQIAPLLNLSEDTVRERLSKKDDIYELLGHGVTEQAVDALKKIRDEQNIKGLYWKPEEARFYPETNIGSSVTGFMGFVDEKRVGQYGIEGFHNKRLSGEVAQADTLGSALTQSKNGDTFILTIDKNIQYNACTFLQEAAEKHNAKKGSVIVMNPKTGAIMALCNVPNYDPNNYGDVEDISVFLNDAVSDQYEPGSVFKIFTMAAGVNEKKVTPYTTYQDNGSVKIGKYEIRNSDRKGHGVTDMRTVLEKSLNTGTTFIEQQVGHERWEDYVTGFGFGKETGIELSGENPGDISAVKKKKDIYGATTSYGQGLTVTPMQLVQAAGAIANEGKMMKPHLIDRVVSANGNQKAVEPEVLGQPITAEAANTVAAMMVGVIDKSLTRAAYVDGYYMSGKTGTAQIPDGRGGYDENRHKSSFVGFGPLADPQFVILVKLDEPQTQWAEGAVSPVFGKLAKYLVNYLEIPPDRK
jgi:cell division protein FtsI/penicillin-binding protein 2